MVLTREYDNNGMVISSRNASRRHVLWKQCMEASRRTIGRINYKFVEREVYIEVFGNDFLNSDTDSMSSFIGLIEIVIELLTGSFSDEVLCYDSVCLHEP